MGSAPLPSKIPWPAQRDKVCPLPPSAGPLQVQRVWCTNAGKGALAQANPTMLLVILGSEYVDDFSVGFLLYHVFTT